MLLFFDSLGAFFHQYVEEAKVTPWWLVACAAVFLFLMAFRRVAFRFKPGYRRYCFFCHQRDTLWAQDDVIIWQCVFCDQTNGFDAEGNTLITSTSQTAYEPGGTAEERKRRQWQVQKRFESHLCSRCERNQGTLIALLAEFDGPASESAFSVAAEKRRLELERRYPLCANCVQTVETRLAQQDHLIKTRQLGQWLQQSVSEKSHVFTATARTRRWRWVRRCQWLLRFLALLPLYEISPWMLYLMVLLLSYAPRSAASLGHPRSQLQGFYLYQVRPCFPAHKTVH